MIDARANNYYELLGVDPDCSFEELRTAYRRLARECHPDVAGNVPGPGATTMTEINEAWWVLSDAERRRRYDEAIRRTWRSRRPSMTDTMQIPVVPRQPAPQTQQARRKAWAAGVQGQIAKLTRLAGRSATQTLLLKAPRAPRSSYEELVEHLVRELCEDTESRVRAARAAGAAPLDLAVGAALIGIRTLADRIRREASLGLTNEVLMSAELLDRMWDVLAHELTAQLAAALGGNPRVTRQILPR